MKKSLLVGFTFIVFGITNVRAQSILDKLDNALNKADRALNSADKAGKTGSKLGGLLGKKEGKETSTTIKISGVDFTKLTSINEKIKASKGVASTKMKFNSEGSTIKVQHSGSTEDLLKALQKNSTTFAEKNLLGLDDGEISVEIK